MSEEPFDENMIDEIENDDDDEQDTLLKQELIAFVKANSALYTKNWKEYAGKDSCKDLAWENIGFNLSKQMSDAAKMWYSICQRFNKKKQKVVASLKGRSGQETKPLYVPKWQYYNLCLFLVDHITPRRTTSNYSSNKMKKIIEETSSSPIFILPLSLPSPSLSARSTPSPQAVSPQILSAQVLSPRALSSQVTSPRLLSSQIVCSQVLSPRAPSSQVLFPQGLFPRATSPQILSVQAPYSRTPSPQVPSS
ncbi:protein IQ-DOMAIN 14-like isoform X1 [Solenopsis invicta]|uniref:protein IQ-DOMAIN 14-like isoform X1 n=1 Tax=Solenopsis invicta TaxID=13686 RepID=UPI000E33F019|nr:protein IQ-DOMAIN 14-like isoform X1 [Solenopsis invicta]